MSAKLGSFKFNILLFFIYFFPFVALLSFVAHFSVNVPYWDQWELVNLFEKVSIGKANFGDFFAQHNEHRLFFPRLIIVTLAFLSKWNIKYELCLSIFFASIIFYAIYKLSYLQLKNKYAISVQLTNILSCILVFSLVQYENWLWGFQVSWFLVNACLVIAVLLITISNNYNSSKIFYFAAIPCFIASFSLAQGLLTWLAVIPSVASFKGSSRQRRIRIIGWILLFAGTCVVYFIGYQKPSHHPSTLFFLKEPLVAGKYFFTLLATPLTHSYSYIVISPIVGLIIFLTFLFLTTFFIIKSKPKLQLDSEVAAWISIGLFALLFALITAVGRVGFGIEQAMSSRYTSSSILLLISIAHLWRLIPIKKGLIAGSIVTVIIIINSIDVISQASLLQLQSQANTTCLELVNFIDNSPDSCLVGLYPSTSRVKELTKIVERLGFRKFPKEITFITKPVKGYGHLDVPSTRETPFTLSKSGSVLNTSGWAILPDSQKLPKAVLFSYGNNRTFFASSVVNLDSPDVAKALNSSRYSKVRWAVNISPKSLPLGETVIKAWVYDPSNQQVVKLNGEPKLKVVE